MITTLLTLMLSAKLNGPMPVTVRQPSIDTTIHSMRIAPEPEKKTDAIASLGAKAAVVMDLETEKVLFEKNLKTRLPIASITKVMTAVVAIETVPNLDTVITVPAEATKVQGSRVWLRNGEKMTYRQLIEAMLIASGNDAATALALSVAGSEKLFVEMMNAKALQLGMKDTHYMNPHGLDTPEAYSTAFDQATLARYALHKKLIRDTVVIKGMEIKSIDGYIHQLTNTNKLLDEDPEIKGFKTGSTENAGECLITLAKDVRGNEIISVLLHSPDRFGEAQYLKSVIWNAYSW